MRERHGVGGHYGQARRHRLHRRDRLQLGDRGDREDARPRVQIAQGLVVDEPVEGDAAVQPQLPHEVLEVSALVSAADDVEADVERRVETGDRAQHDIDVLLGRQAPDEQDAVLLPRRDHRRVAGAVDAAADRDDARDADGRLEEVGGLARRRRDGAGHVEGAPGVVPGELDDELVDQRRQSGEVQDVLGHDVVGRDDGDPALAGDAGDAATDDDVRLDVHDVRLHGLQHPTGVELRHPRDHERQPVVRVVAPGGQPVHRELLALDLLDEAAVPPARRARSHDVHVVPAADQARGQALGEAGGAVDVRQEGVSGDEDGQRLRLLGVTV